MDSCVALEYFKACEGEMTRRLSSVLEGFADARDFLSPLFEKRGAPSSSPRQTLEEPFTFLYISIPGNEHCELKRPMISGTKF